MDTLRDIPIVRFLSNVEIWFRGTKYSRNSLLSLDPRLPENRDYALQVEETIEGNHVRLVDKYHARGFSNPFASPRVPQRVMTVEETLGWLLYEAGESDLLPWTNLKVFRADYGFRGDGYSIVADTEIAYDKTPVINAIGIDLKVINAT